MRAPHALTFRQILESTRREAAASAWRRAGLASALRHGLSHKRDRHGAARLAQVKAEALRLVADLLPAEVSVTIDDDYQVGLLSFRWRGHGRFHLPAAASAGEGRKPARVAASA